MCGMRQNYEFQIALATLQLIPYNAMHQITLPMHDVVPFKSSDSSSTPVSIQHCSQCMSPSLHTLILSDLWIIPEEYEGLRFCLGQADCLIKQEAVLE